MRYAETHKAETRAKVIETAARVLRRDGIDGTGLAGLMGEAGLTKGGFYAHFASKDALVAEAASASLRASAARMRARAKAAEEQGCSALEAIVDAYLSPGHAQKPEAGCTLGALLSDLTRSAPIVRDAASGGAALLVDAVEDALPGSLGAGRRPRAQAIVGMLAGCLQLARLETDETARHAILLAARNAALQLAIAPIG